MLEDQLRELHSLGMKALALTGKTGNEPRTMYRILPPGKAVIIFYSSCFSFIPNNSNQLVIKPDELGYYIDKARKEVEYYEMIKGRAEHAHASFKPRPYVIPFVICVNGMKRIYKVHLCKDHRKDRISYKPKCKCYITWEEFGE